MSAVILEVLVIFYNVDPFLYWYSDMNFMCGS